MRAIPMSSEYITELYRLNDQIEKEIAKINRGGVSTKSKSQLFKELNQNIEEIQRAETEDTNVE